MGRASFRMIGMLRKKRSLMKLAIVLILLFVIAPAVTTASTVQILTGVPGDTISYTGSGPSDSDLSLELSTTTAVGVSGGQYSKTFSSIVIPDRSNTFRVSGSPVQSLYVAGKGPVTAGIWTPGLGGGSSFTSPMSIPAGTYDVKVYGNAVNGASSVNLDVKVASTVHTDSAGAYSGSLSSHGLPAGLYILKQSGTEVADIYLGIAPPPQPPSNEKTATINLHEGWNLMSLPVRPDSTQITDIFTEEQLLDVDVIWDYNSGDWQYWTTEPGYTNQFSSLDPKKGYYVYCYAPISVTVTGVSTAPKTMSQLSPGWNLIGYPLTYDSAISSRYASAVLIWKYDGGWQYWTTLEGYANQFDQLSPGLGYWVYK